MAERELLTLTLTLREDATSVSATASVFRSLEVLLGAGAWLDISGPQVATMLAAGREAIATEARRHPTSRTGRAALLIFGELPAEPYEGIHGSLAVSCG